MIAVKDASGKILWSWHIWATDFDPNAKTLKYTNDNGSTWEFMDRNLGAANAESGSFGAFGLLYQWGRKDPSRRLRPSLLKIRAKRYAGTC